MFKQRNQHMEERAHLMGRMIERLDVDVTKVAVAAGGQDFANAIRHCVSCGAGEECQGYLDDPTATGTPHFCPNARLFRENTARKS